MSMPRYREYKDSGIPWVGDVPVHWDVRPLVGVAIERSESNAGMQENNLLSLSYGRIVRKNIDSNDGLLPESFDTYQVVHEGDIVLRLTDLQNDKRSLRSAQVRERGIITSAYLALQPTGAASAFLSYLLRAYDLTKVFYSMGGGLRQSMKFAELKRLPIAVPPAAEQTALAAFLDRETAKIDALIAEQEKLIALLAEKRQATISHAVTKGLNRNATMKDSGVAWLAEVPAHWGVTRLKYATDAVVDCPHETPVYDESGRYRVIRTADVSEGRLHLDQMYSVAQHEFLLRIRRMPLEQNDIVYGREGERWGFAAQVPASDTFCLGQRMMQFRAAAGINPRFLMWQLNAQSTYRQGQMDTVGATSPHVNVSTIKNYALTHPPIGEQEKISEFLDAETSRLDKLDAEAARTILLLKERRGALITAVVTGQIDVRGAVPPAAAESREAIAA